MTSQSPWKIGSSDEADLCRTRPLCLAIDTELAVMQGYRLLESESGHFLCEDWISNVCFIYVYDMAQDQYLWTNRAYPRFRKDLNNTIEEGALQYHDEFGNDPPMPVQGTGTICHPDGAVGKHERWPRVEGQDIPTDPTKIIKASDLSGMVHSILKDAQYDRWSGVILPNRPLILDEHTTDVVGIQDERAPREQKVDLPYQSIVMVCRRPEGSSKRGLNLFPAVAQQQREDRFDLEAWRPSKEGRRTKWRLVRTLRIPEFECHLCREPMLDGFMICPMCGSYLTIFTDMQTALFYQRLESIAQKMGLTIEQSDYDEGYIRGTTHRGQGEERRPARSLLWVIKDGALSHYQRAIN